MATTWILGIWKRGLRDELMHLVWQHDGSEASVKAAEAYAAALPTQAQLRSQIRTRLAAGATMAEVAAALFDMHDPSAIYDIDMALASSLQGPQGEPGTDGADGDAAADVNVDAIVMDVKREHRSPPRDQQGGRHESGDGSCLGDGCAHGLHRI